METKAQNFDISISEKLEFSEVDGSEKLSFSDPLGSISFGWFIV